MSYGLVVLALVTPMLIIGSWMLIAGLRGRLVAGVTECAGCRFDLAGIDPNNPCPECGRSLRAAGATRPRRVRRRGLIAIGALLLVIAAAPVVLRAASMAAGANLIQHAPVWWLRMELKHAGPTRAAEVGKELDLRLTGTLRSMTTAEAQAAADDLSAILIDPNASWNPGWSNFYERARLQNLVTDEQWTRYVEKLINVAFLTRQRVRAGDELPLSIELRGTMFADGSFPVPMVRVRGELVGATVGEREVSVSSGSFFMGSVTRLGMAGWSRSIRSAAPPGKTTLQARYRFEVVTADHQERTVGSFTQEHQAEILIVGDDEPVVAVVSDDALADTIRASLAVSQLECHDNTQLDWMIQGTNVPTDVAFRVIVRPRDGALSGREFDIGSANFQAGSSSGYGGGGRVEGLDATSVDLILRPSVEVAERSPKLRSVWIGPDIVLENPNFSRRITTPGQP